MSAQHDPEGITVYGHGRVETEPDQAELQLAVSRIEAEPADAFAAARAAVSAVRTTLQLSGLPENAIEVSRLRLNAVYDYPDGKNRLTGHEAAADVTVAIADIEATDAIVTTAIDAGANAVQSLVFDTTGRAALAEAARRAAVADALGKATVYADAAGVQVGAVIGIEEAGAGGPVPMAGRALMAESADRAFVAGGITIEASVRLRLAIGLVQSD
ncbi:MAG: SIMPL domain-containing protein [Acidimicrobiia bacterium]|nr:SIMPL domain-containing protein [Acidimicrobiia bacterium]